MKKILSVLLLSLIAWACTEDETQINDNDSFDRAAMLTNWADNIIIPGYVNYKSKVDVLAEAKSTFTSNPTVENLTTLRAAWLDAYISWQKVSMFEIGKAETLGLRGYTNIYPTNDEEIEQLASSGTYDLELPSTRDAQGFPALDYLLNGTATTDAEIVARFTTEESLSIYLSDITDRLKNHAALVLDDWQNGYRDTFVSNDGSSATSSVNKLVNDYMFYYEKHLRAGKIGIPAGVFSNTTLSTNVEAFYKQDVSKTLFDAALQASVDFFNGKHFDGNGQGESLKSYLDFLNTITGGEQLSALINNQFDQAKQAASTLDENFYQQVESNNEAMLLTYDELQKNVVLMKVDMFQALNVKVDFVDADGD